MINRVRCSNFMMPTILIISIVIDTVVIILLIIMNFYSPVCNARCQSRAQYKNSKSEIREDSPGNWNEPWR